jgi:hypothetical protein
MPTALSSALRNHCPGCVALVALVIGALFIAWVRQETSVTHNVFQGWRQIVIVLCTGVVIGGVASELAAAVARTRPGETPTGSAFIAAIFALPCYALLILASLVFLN